MTRKEIDIIFDPKYGLAKSEFRLGRQYGAPNFFYEYAVSIDSQKLGNEIENIRTSGGASPHGALGAKVKATGELMERYCSGIFHSEDFHFEAYDDAPDEKVHPDIFSFYAKIQTEQKGFYYDFFDTKAKINWAKSYDVFNNTFRWVPASTVFVPYEFAKAKGEAKINQSISTGLACHSDFYKCYNKCILEVLERDAYCMYWQLGLSPVLIEGTGLPSRSQNMLDAFLKYGCEVQLYLLETDVGVPVVQASLINYHPARAPYALSCACHWDIDLAIEGALEELAHTYMYLENIHGTDYKPIASPQDVTQSLDHLVYWSDPKRLPQMNHILQTPKRIQYQDISRQTFSSQKELNSILLQKLKDAGLHLFFNDLTTPDIRSLGFWVLRVIIPECQPLAMGHKYRYLKCHRMWQRAEQEGLYETAGLQLYQDINLPHGFP